MEKTEAGFRGLCIGGITLTEQLFCNTTVPDAMEICFPMERGIQVLDLNDIDIGYKPCWPQTKTTTSYTILATRNVDISHTEVDSE